jgi:hypothetical protein
VRAGDGAVPVRDRVGEGAKLTVRATDERPSIAGPNARFDQLAVETERASSQRDRVVQEIPADKQLSRRRGGTQI